MQFAIVILVLAATVSLVSVLEATPSRSQMIANFKRVMDNGSRLRRNVDSIPTTSDNTFQINDTGTCTQKTNFRYKIVIEINIV